MFMMLRMDNKIFEVVPQDRDGNSRAEYKKLRMEVERFGWTIPEEEVTIKVSENGTDVTVNWLGRVYQTTTIDLILKQYQDDWVILEHTAQ